MQEKPHTTHYGGLEREQIDERAHPASEQGQSTGERLQANVTEQGAVVAERADAAMSATGERMTDAAQRLRERAPEGRLGDVATGAADAIERSGEYLQQADVGKVRNDLELLMREHPVETLLVGIGIGYLLARATRR